MTDKSKIDKLISSFLIDRAIEKVGQQDSSAITPIMNTHEMQTTNKYCIVTLLTSDDFFPGVKALVHSLAQVQSQYNVLVLVTHNISCSTKISLQQCVEILLIEPIHFQHMNQERPDAPWSGSELSKIHIWNLLQYEKVLYIDADCIVVRSVDHLFDINVDLAAAPDLFPPDKFNAGVLLIRPSAEVYAHLLSSIVNMVSYDGGDTGFLNSCFPDWYEGSTSSHRLPFAYNAQRTLFWFTHEKNPQYWCAVGPVYIIHFSSSPKPWNCPGTNTIVGGDLEWLWWQVYLGILQ